MLKGSCLCGSIEYQYSGDINEIAMCHCQQCRKAQGSAFGTNAPINSSEFQFLSGKENLKFFHATPEKLRAFCSECGSPIYSQRLDTPEIMRLRIGTLDTKISHKPDYHIFYDSKAEWYTAGDNLTKYPELNTPNAGKK